MRRSLTHRRAAVVLLAAIIAGLPLHLWAQHHKREAREEITTLEDQWRQAQLNDDVPAMDKLLSDDYLGVTATGDVVTKVQQLDRMRSREIMVSRIQISDVKIKLLGNRVAVVNGLSSIDAIRDKHPITLNFRFTRVYQRLPSGIWKITSFEPTRISPARRNTSAPQAANSAPQPPSAR
jgi:hypothetical protein